MFRSNKGTDRNSNVSDPQDKQELELPVRNRIDKVSSSGELARVPSMFKHKSMETFKTRAVRATLILGNSEGEDKRERVCVYVCVYDCKWYMTHSS